MGQFQTYHMKKVEILHEVNLKTIVYYYYFKNKICKPIVTAFYIVV